MDQPLSLGAIARASGADLLATRTLTPAQIKVLRSIADCRTEAMGGHRDRCDRCEYEHTFWNSCRDRHCPGCGAEARESWLEKRREEVLDVPYFHVVFTIPERLNALVLHAPEILYAILLRAAGQALLDVAASKLRAHIGVLTVLHTWGQTLAFHPHVHCVVPGGGFSFDGRRWVHIPTGTFLLAVKVLSRRFRTLVKNAITEAYVDGSLVIPPPIARDRTALDLLLACASKTDWHSYVKPPFGGPEQVLAYLASYTHRVAISNQRIIAFDGERVTFLYRDYHDGNARKSMDLPAAEFLRRFLMHVVPARFTRIRYYGFLANRDRSANIEKARTLIGSARTLAPRAPAPDPRLCPQCGQGTMRTEQRSTLSVPEHGSTRHEHGPRDPSHSCAARAALRQLRALRRTHVKSAAIRRSCRAAGSRFHPIQPRSHSTSRCSCPPCSPSQPLALRYFPHVGPRLRPT